MAKADDLAEITRALSAPLGELIAAVGRGVADAQWALDQHTVETFKAVYGGNEAAYQELRQLGYQPTWYRIPEVAAEIYVTLSASGEERLGFGAGSATSSAQTLPQGETGPGRIQLYATPVDASYSNTYDYQLRACSQLKFRIVPVPASGQAEGMKVVPKLVGMQYQAAQATLDQLGIPYALADPYFEPQGHENITSTAPEAGSILPSGQTLVLTLAIG
ncbi:MAG: PASTA domain-containing protein [Pseudomonadota bacterium]